MSMESIKTPSGLTLIQMRFVDNRSNSHLVATLSSGMQNRETEHLHAVTCDG
jgi:hypothetical protein